MPTWRRHLTAEERIARRQDGPARLATVGRRPVGTGHGPLGPVRPLEEQAGSRVADVIPIRHGRMLASPFKFYQEATLIMAP